MSKAKRLTIILLVFFGTPIIGLFLGWLLSTKGDQDSVSQGLGLVFGLFLGVVVAVLSLILGVVVSFLARNSKNQYYSLIGYFIPPALFIIYLLLAFIFA